MNKHLLKSFMARQGDTQSDLAQAIGLSLSRLNAKINEKYGAEFTQGEIALITERYHLSPEEVSAVFFDPKVS